MQRADALLRQGGQIHLQEMRYELDGHQFFDARAGRFDQATSGDLQSFAQDVSQGNQAQEQNGRLDKTICVQPIPCSALHLIDELAEEQRYRGVTGADQRHQQRRAAQCRLVATRHQTPDLSAAPCDQTQFTPETIGRAGGTVIHGASCAKRGFPSEVER